MPAAAGAFRSRCGRLGFHLRGVAKRQQVHDIGVRGTLRQLGQHVQQIRMRLDTTGAARQHQAVHHRAGFRAGHAVTEQP
jgi:hypothetical protein